MSLNELVAKIESRTAVLGVVGLGYVGLPVACIFADAGFKVVGVDKRADLVEIISKGNSPIEGIEPGLAALVRGVINTNALVPTTDFHELKNADVIIICVDTPVDSNHIPIFAALESACTSIGKVLKLGALVIVESTISPGTIDNKVKPILEEITGTTVNNGFYLGHCPERVMPGRLLANLRTMSRVCGGSNRDTSSLMMKLYRVVVQADLDETDCLTAELVKTIENTYRDVQIAFANEMALICEAVGGDIWRVRELVNKSPGRSVLYPGAGVGGHCIPKDPWLLAYSVRHKNVQLSIVPAAREVNSNMPEHLIQLLLRALHHHDRKLEQSKILMLGYAYLEDSDDTRNSPSKMAAERLSELGAELWIHDPYVEAYKQLNIEAGLENADAIMVMVAHTEYRQLELRKLIRLVRTPIIVDGRHVFEVHDAKQAGFTYLGIGQTNYLNETHQIQLDEEQT